MNLHKIFTLLFVILVAISTLVGHAYAQTTSDQNQVIKPEMLLGEFWGNWQAKHFASANGHFYLTAVRTEGNKLGGEIELTGRITLPPKEEFEATLNGNRLSLKTSTRTVELTISVVDGKIRMDGEGYGTVPYYIKDLVKVK